MLEKEDDRQHLHALQVYVAQLLGTRIDIAPLDTRRLPAFIADRYALFETHILHRPCVLLVPRTELDATPGTTAKHLAVVQQAFPDHIGIVFAERISTHNRQRLIAQHVPFIIPGNQMFVPDLAIDLREHFRKAREAPAETLGPTAQLLVLAALRGPLTETTPTGLATRLGYSAMSMSRAIDELEAVEMVTTSIQGKFRHVDFVDIGPSLWRRARTLLRSPVRKRHVIGWSREAAELPLAGGTALGDWTDLTPPMVEVRAIAAADWNSFVRRNDIDTSPGWAEAQLEIETWSYDPLILGDHRIVDPVSLWLSLPDSSDERFGLAKDQLLKDVGL